MVRLVAFRHMAFIQVIFATTSQCSSTFSSSFNSFFEYKSDTVILNDVKAYGTIFTSVTLLQCLIHCQEHRCTSIAYDKNNSGGNGGCIIYKLPLKELRFSSSSAFNAIGKDILVMKPCAQPNTNCLHGGVCSRNVSSIKGYDCECAGKWTGDVCEEGW